MLLLIAGNETTTNTVANGALAVMEQPDQWRIVMRDPGMVSSFVEESLRYDSPIQGLFRSTRTAVDVAGTTIPAGARVLLLFGSANRDDRHYPDADTFIGSRNPIDHLAFGKGIHFCLGAHLARLELTVLLRTLLTRLRRFLPDGEVVRVPNPIARGVHRLPVIVEGR
jgi:cytochrome P450